MANLQFKNERMDKSMIESHTNVTQILRYSAVLIEIILNATNVM